MGTLKSPDSGRIWPYSTAIRGCMRLRLVIRALCVTICRTLLIKNPAHRALRASARDPNLVWLSRKASVRSKSARLKEIHMDTSKVIELGKVSEETKGYPHSELEHPGDLFRGPIPG
jgi:hypothetical protein